MISINKLIKDSIQSYKNNFNKLITLYAITTIFGLVATYISALMDKSKDTLDLSNIFSYFIALIVISLISGLYFIPVLYRAIQKSVDNNMVDTAEAFSFQNKNIWNWFTLHIWNTLYFIKVNIIAVILAIVVIILSLFFIKDEMIMGFILAAALVILMLLTLKNLPKFVFYQNIFFSKEIKARDAVRESIAFAEGKTKDVWMSVITLFIIAFAIFIINIFIGAVIALTSLDTLSISIILSILQGFVFTPIIFTTLAVAYTTLKNSTPATETPVVETPVTETLAQPTETPTLETITTENQ